MMRGDMIIAEAKVRLAGPRTRLGEDELKYAGLTSAVALLEI
jgi:hypothetical protein